MKNILITFFILLNITALADVMPYYINSLRRYGIGYTSIQSPLVMRRTPSNDGEILETLNFDYQASASCLINKKRCSIDEIFAAYSQSKKDSEHYAKNSSANNANNNSSNDTYSNHQGSSNANNVQESSGSSSNNEPVDIYFPAPEETSGSSSNNEPVDVYFPAPDSAEVSSINTGISNPSDFSYKHTESNILAAKARNMGFSDEQIKIAIGISRWETGNYEHLAGGYNYGGVTGSGDAGQSVFYDQDGNQYAKYSSPDVGMDAYLNNLKKNYFDQGLTSVESMARKYLGYDNTSSWINGVYGCMS